MTTIIVSNTYQDAQGFGLSGTVTFTPVTTADDGGSITYIADPVAARVQAGVLSKELVTTDTYDVPGTVTYRVVERIGASYRRRYYVEIPSSLGSSVVLGTLQQFSNPPNTLVLEGIGDVSAAINDLDARLDTQEALPLLTDHEAAADPHSAAGYLTQTVADTLYGSQQATLPTGGSTGQVLAKQSAADQDVDWEDQAATTLTPPVTFTATDPADVPLTLEGAASQTADLFEIKDNSANLKLAVLAGGQVRIGTTPPTGGTLRIEQNSTSGRGIVLKQKAGGTADPLDITDSADASVMTVEADGTVNGLNVGTDPTTGNFYAPNLVLDNAAAVPAGTPAGTLILRRPA